jgi:hypothetical protein
MRKKPRRGECKGWLVGWLVGLGCVRSMGVGGDWLLGLGDVINVRKMVGREKPRIGKRW